MIQWHHYDKERIRAYLGNKCVGGVNPSWYKPGYWDWSANPSKYGQTSTRYGTCRRRCDAKLALELYVTGGGRRDLYFVHPSSLFADQYDHLFLTQVRKDRNEVRRARHRGGRRAARRATHRYGGAWAGHKRGEGR